MWLSILTDDFAARVTTWELPLNVLSVADFPVIEDNIFINSIDSINSVRTHHDVSEVRVG